MQGSELSATNQLDHGMQRAAPSSIARSIKLAARPRSTWMRFAILAIASALHLSIGSTLRPLHAEDRPSSEALKTDNSTIINAPDKPIATDTIAAQHKLTTSSADRAPQTLELHFEIATTKSESPGIVLNGPDARAQLLVTGTAPDGNLRDMTRDVTFELQPAGILAIDNQGFMKPLAAGQAKVIARRTGYPSAEIVVEVKNWNDAPTVHFQNQVVPIFTKLGCNGGGCHGKASGQNGFQLSLLGFEPNEDFVHIVKEARGRRVSPAAPDRSLILQKALNAIPHGGGQRMEKDSHEYRILRRWIAQGMPRGNPGDPQVVAIEVLPDHRRLASGDSQQLSVQALYSNGEREDVTRMVQFESNDTDMADVSAQGLVSLQQLAGNVAVMARYQGQVATFRASVPIAGEASVWPEPKNAIDAAVLQQLKSLNIPVSEVCDDATFLRRISLDIRGRLPTLAETRTIMNDSDPQKRAQWIDRFLDSDDYATYFANKWIMILRNRRDRASLKSGTFAFHDWIRDQLAQNRPYDEFVRDVLVASGSIDVYPPVAWYRSVTDTNSRVEDAAQAFLGQRIQCARCHHHPFEKWSQRDYYQMFAFFSLVRTKTGANQDETTIFTAVGQPRAPHPKTGESLKAAGLGGPALDIPDGADPRNHLVDWMVAPENPFFAKALANRYWKHFFGRGLIEPEDDMRATNPPSNPELLDALAQHFIESKCDLKAMIRFICNSDTYQRSSHVQGTNLRDRKCYSRCYPRRLSAEVLLDAMDDVLQSTTPFEGVPNATRAVSLPDTGFPSYFMSVFGRPEAATTSECERATESTLAQSLHLTNSKELQKKLSDDHARPALMAADSRPVEDKVGELYLSAYCRWPTASEMQTAVTYVTSKSDKRAAYEDLVWAVLNSKEFLFNH